MHLASLSLSTRELRCFVHGLARLAIVVVMAGCGSDEGSSSTGPPNAGPPDAGPVECDAGEMPLEDGGCQPAGLPPDMPCPPGEASVGEGCQPAGVPPEACGQGFETDGQGGCTPILPAAPCPPGKMAIPGETQCREVAPCGSGDYGTIPVEATTKFVNGAYAGNDSNGTQAKPWKTIQDGIDSAKPGAIVAVAAGSYTEDLLIKPRPVRLWGRCPAMVSVVGTGSTIASLTIVRKGASKSEVHSLAITGPGIGIGTSGSSDVLVERVWIHDTTSLGLDMNVGLGPSSVTMSASLIETAKESGVNVDGSDATIEATTVRDTQPREDGTGGHGINLQAALDTHKHATLTLRTSLLERNHDVGVRALGSDATIEATVVRDTQPRKDGTRGYGISIRYDAETQARSTLMLRTSLLEQNHEYGVVVEGSDAEIEATVVRTTQPSGDKELGYGIASTSVALERPKVTLRTSLLELNHGVGVVAWGSDVTIDATVVRDSQPDGNGAFGRGIDVYDDLTTHERSALMLRYSLLEQNHDVGILITGSDATIEATVVRDTQPTPQSINGMGIAIQRNFSSQERTIAELRHSVVENNHGNGVHIFESDVSIEASIVRATQPASDGTNGRGIGVEQSATLTLRTSLMEDNHELGVFIQDSSATIEDTVVRATQPEGDGTGGDGIAVASVDAPATATITSTRIEDNARAGITNHSAAVILVSSIVQCNLFNLDGEEVVEGQGFTFDGSKDNLCGCGDKLDPTCPVVSEDLSAPEAISPVNPSN